jgi:hypothetical protein
VPPYLAESALLYGRASLLSVFEAVFGQDVIERRRKIRRKRQEPLLFTGGWRGAVGFRA